MYDEFYGLRGKPFQLTPDQRFFFDSRGHHRAMAYLRYGLEQKEGFIVITGGIGTGKTMLVRTLFDELEDRNIMAAQLVTTQIEPEDMLRMVCASFGLTHEGIDKATMLQRLEATARKRFAEHKRILLIVDEAQNLPASSLEELRMLANFQVEGRSLFQSFLLGQSELRRTLSAPNMEQLRQRIIASYHLEPLTEEETRDYIEYRLRQVDWSGTPKLDDDLFPGIYAFTDGIPRRINSLCDRLFLYGCIEEKVELGSDDLDVVQAEMQGEAGHAQRPSDPTSDHQLAPQRMLGDQAELQMDVDARSAADHLAERLARVETDLIELRKIVLQERKLLRKAVLLQLELDAYDDID